MYIVYPSVMAVGSLESLITISNRFGIQMLDSGVNHADIQSLSRLLQKLMNVNSHKKNIFLKVNLKKNGRQLKKRGKSIFSRSRGGKNGDD